jgi:zinc protease
MIVAAAPAGRAGFVNFDRIAMTSSTSSALQVANFTLSNGLDVVVIPDHRAPVVTHMVWYRNI